MNVGPINVFTLLASIQLYYYDLCSKADKKIMGKLQLQCNKKTENAMNFELTYKQGNKYSNLAKPNLETISEWPEWLEKKRVEWGLAEMGREKIIL